MVSVLHYAVHYGMYTLYYTVAQFGMFWSLFSVVLELSTPQHKLRWGYVNPNTFLIFPTYNVNRKTCGGGEVGLPQSGNVPPLWGIRQMSVQCQPQAAHTCPYQPIARPNPARINF